MNLMPEAKTQKMSSEDLFYMVCKARKEFKESIPRMNDFHNRVADELEGEDYESFVVQNPNKTESTYYWLTQEQCLLVGMRESKSVRREVTKKIKELMTPALPDFNDPVASARAWADAKESEQKALLVIKEQAPKVEYHDKVLATENGLTTTEIAAELGMSAIALNKALQDMKVQRKVGGRWVLTVAYINQGYDVEVTHVDDGGISRHAMKWTEKGRKLIHELMENKW